MVNLYNINQIKEELVNKEEVETWHKCLSHFKAYTNIPILKFVPKLILDLTFGNNF